ncbi:MAG: thiamine pyrophosphate-binding protein, partial [Candidatus Ranarchaeia archaeon]
FPIKIGLTGDASGVITKLLTQVKSKTRDEAYFKEIERIKQEHLEDLQKDKMNNDTPINPGLVIQTLQQHAKKNAIICVDVGDHTYWFYKKFVSDGHQTYMSSNMASMGFALPAAIVAQLDFPERQVICVTGDGGFGMNMADFSTAVYNNLPIKVIVFNDSKLKNIKKEQAMYGYKEFGVAFVNPNFAEFAKSFGGAGFRVEDPKDLNQAIKNAFDSNKPAIVDVVVDPEKLAPSVKYPPKTK